jgi:hypothetical protein
MEDVRRLPVGEDDNQIAISLDELAREGARRMIATALKAEADEYVASFVEELDEHGKRLVVRNGLAKERRVTIGSGTVAIRAPRAARQARGRADRGAPAVQLADPAGLRAPLAEGQRRAPCPVPARALDRRLPPGA